MGERCSGASILIVLLYVRGPLPGGQRRMSGLFSGRAICVYLIARNHRGLRWRICPVLVECGGRGSRSGCGGTKVQAKRVAVLAGPGCQSKSLLLFPSGRKANLEFKIWNLERKSHFAI